jgi:hypothetical protein
MLTHAERFGWQQSVLACPKLTATQKNVLTRLALFHNIKTGRCDPSIETLANGAGVTRRAVQKALAAGEALGFILRKLGGGKYVTTRYELSLPPAETLNAGAPFRETVNRETVNRKTLFDGETLNDGAQNPERRDAKPRPAVHPNIEGNKKENIEKKIEPDFEEWFRQYPRREAKRAALKAYKHALSRGATAEELRLGAMRYAAIRQRENPKFTKLPTTWLNGDCWKDEPIASQGGPHAAEDVRTPSDVKPRAAAQGTIAAGMAAALRERPDSRLYESDDPSRVGVDRRTASGGNDSR